LNKKKTYAFSEIEQYREHLEIKNLRGKTTIITVVFFILLLMTMTYMIIAKYSWDLIIPLGIAFIIVLLFSFIMTAYGENDYSYLKINRYLLTLGMFSVVTLMIILLQSPSIFPLLFVIYCLASIYQDLKVIIISDLYFIFIMIFVVANYPNMFIALNNTNGNQFNMTLFSILFLAMLTISSYIIMKEKSFFYNQISKSKEVEYRNIDLLLKLKYQTNKEEKDFLGCYEQVNSFLDAFSKKLDLPNIFTEKMNILLALEKNIDYQTILEKYPEYTKEDLNRLNNLIISRHSVLNRIAVKISKTKNVDIKRREIFSATHFKTLNKQTDKVEVHIIAFVIFYVTLKKGLFGLNKISDEKIYNMITNTDYYYYIDYRVMKIYQENPEVFNIIISEAFESGGDK